MPLFADKVLSSKTSSAIYQDCSNILSQSFMVSYANYYFSILSNSAYIQHLKKIVCEILFTREKYREEILVKDLISDGKGIIRKIVHYGDQAQLGSISLIKIFTEISNRMERMTLIGEAARYGMHKVVASFLKLNASPNAGICPPLHRAAMGASKISQDKVLKFLKTARLLIKNGADVDLKDPQGNTALHFSTFSLSFTKVLVNEGGASLSRWNGNGSTPLDNAQWGSWFYSSAGETSKFLAEKGAENGFFKNFYKNFGEIFLFSNIYSMESKWTKAALYKLYYTSISQKIMHYYYDALDGCQSLE